MRSSVDFPHPEGPTSTRNSPPATVSVTFFTAWLPRPKLLETPASSTPDIAAPPAPAGQVHADVAHEQHQRADHEPGELGLEGVDERVGVREQLRVTAQHLLAEARQHPAPRERAQE